MSGEARQSDAGRGGEWLAVVRPVSWMRAPGVADDPSDRRSVEALAREQESAAAGAPDPQPHRHSRDASTPAVSAEAQPDEGTSPAASDSSAASVVTVSTMPEAVFDWDHDGGGGGRVSPSAAETVEAGDDPNGASPPEEGIRRDGPGGGAGDDEDAPTGRRSRGRLAMLLAGVVVLAGAGTGYWLISDDDGASTASESSGPVATDEVARQTISATETWSGRLGHGEPFEVATAATGTLTGVIEYGSAVQRGTELYRVDELPVVAMFGEVPMYRPLESGATGADVLQLEDNLAQLGYEGFDVDDEFTDATAEAVREWQADLGVEETGVVSPADVVFVPQGRTVGTVHVSVGDALQPGAAVLNVTGSEQIVDIEVDVRDRGLVEVGTEVTAQLPGGEEVPATVTAASVVEAASDESGEDGSGSEDTIVEVEVTLDEQADESLAGAPADVVVEVDTREDALVVPVTALVALSGGSHGLEVVADDGSTSMVEVETGLFADGMVEITSGDVEAGTAVGVAGR